MFSSAENPFRFAANIIDSNVELEHHFNLFFLCICLNPLSWLHEQPFFVGSFLRRVNNKTKNYIVSCFDALYPLYRKKVKAFSNFYSAFFIASVVVDAAKDISSVPCDLIGKYSTYATLKTKINFTFLRNLKSCSRVVEETSYGSLGVNSIRLG